MTNSSTPALSVRNYSKTFGTNHALTDVSFDVGEGEIHALLGQNGSGKSTLIKCLAGVHTPSNGSAEVGGERLPHLFPPNHAHRYGLSFVHQDLGLISNMSVAENIGLGAGFATHRSKLISWQGQRRQTQQLLDRFELTIRPRDLVRDISPIQRTLLTIARAIGSHAHAANLKCIVLDEPTAALPDADAELLFAHLRRLSQSGVGILYVSHRLSEILDLTTTVTVLLGGKCVGSFPTAGLTESDLVAKMIGAREPSLVPNVARRKSATSVPAADRPAALCVKDLSGPAVVGASLSINPGEIVGIAGLAGSGRTHLAKTLFGAEPMTAGTISVNGAECRVSNPRDAKRIGISLVPEERRAEGCILGLSSGHNASLTTLSERSRMGLLSSKSDRRFASELIGRFRVRPGNPDQRMATLSGGNQQKVVIAKWIAAKPAVLILDEPTQGVDVAAKREIYALLQEAADNGTAVLMIDSELENLTQLCSRILIMRNRQIVGELSGDDVTHDNVVTAVFAAHPTSPHTEEETTYARIE